MTVHLKTVGTGVILSNGLPCSKAGNVLRTALYRKNDVPLPEGGYSRQTDTRRRM